MEEIYSTQNSIPALTHHLMDGEEIANQQNVSPPVILTIHERIYKWEPVGSPLDQGDEANG